MLGEEDGCGQAKWVLGGGAMEPAAFGRQMAQEPWLSALGREQSCWENITGERKKKEMHGPAAC